MTKNNFDDICAICGGRRGLHNNMNQACPMNISAPNDHTEYRSTVFSSTKPLANENQSLPSDKILSVKERSNMDLLELVCQLHSRALNFPSKQMHDTYMNARQELQYRLGCLEERATPSETGINLIELKEKFKKLFEGETKESFNKWLLSKGYSLPSSTECFKYDEEIDDKIIVDTSRTKKSIDDKALLILKK